MNKFILKAQIALAKLPLDKWLYNPNFVKQ